MKKKLKVFEKVEVNKTAVFLDSVPGEVQFIAFFCLLIHTCVHTCVHSTKYSPHGARVPGAVQTCRVTVLSQAGSILGSSGSRSRTESG